MVLLVAGFLLALTASPLSAQQARGIFFSVFGPQAPDVFGDPDHRQAFYFDVPVDEAKPVYLRIFDANVGGRYEERHGTFNTRARYILVGGESANRVYTSKLDPLAPDVYFDNQDIIYDRTIGNDPALDATYFVIGDLPKGSGFVTEDGYRRYALIVIGLGGDDSNYFDLLLSYDPDAKTIPTTTRTFVYDLSIRIPDQEEFLGQIKLDTYGNEQLNISTYDMDDVPMAIEIPMRADHPLEPSGDGRWLTTEYRVPDPELTKQVGLNIFGRDFNNTFGLMVRDTSGMPLKISLPIKDYQPTEEPVITQGFSYEAEDCSNITFETRFAKQGSFEATDFTWTFADDTLSGRQISRTFDEVGYHPYNLTVTGLLSGVVTRVEFTDSVYVNRKPTAWAGGDRVHVPGQPMAFDGTVSEDRDGKIEAYIWDFGDGTDGRGARIDHTYEAPGLFTVTLRVQDNSNTPCGFATARSEVKINTPPEPKIIVPEFIQVGEVFTLDGSQSVDPDGRITKHLWHIGDDTTLTGPLVQWRFDTNEIPPIHFEIRDESNVANSVVVRDVNLSINKLPVADAGFDKKVSPGRPARYNAGKSYDPDGRITAYHWDFGEYQSDEPLVDYAFQEPGTYTVVLKVTDDTGRGTDHDTMKVFVNAPPVPLIAGKDLYTSGRVRFSATESYDPDGSILSYDWSMGDGTTLSGEEIRHIYRKPGKYRVELSVTDNSDTYSAVQITRKEVVVNRLPVARIDAPLRAVPGEAILFNAETSYDPDGEVTGYRWDFGDATSAEGFEVSHSYAEPGTYQVQLAVNDNTGLEDAVGYDHIEVKVNHPPVIVADAPNDAAPDEEVTIDAGESYDPDGEIASWYWNLDGEWQRGTSRITVKGTELKSGVKLRVEDGAGLANSRVEQTFTTEMNLAPVAMAGDDIRTHEHTILFDGTESFDPDGDDLRYYWDFGDGGSAEGAIISHTYRHGGRYNAVLTVDDQRLLNNSFSRDTVEVFINRPPDAFFQTPFAVCVEDTFRFDGSQSFDIDGNENLRYAWTFGDGANAQAKTGLHTYEEIGNYQIVLNVDDTEGMPNSTSSYAETIQVVGAPKADAGENLEVCEDETIQFDGTNSVAAEGFLNEYVWEFGDGATGSGTTPIHTYTEAGTYDVKLTVIGNDYGSCPNRSSDYTRVRVLKRPEARFSVPRFLIEGEELVLDASPTMEQNIRLRSFTWTIGTVDTVTWRKREYSDSTGTVREWVAISTSGEITNVIPVDSLTGRLPITRKAMPVGSFNIKLRIETEASGSCSSSAASRLMDVKQRKELALEQIPTLVPGVPFEFSLDNDLGGLEDYETVKWIFGDGTEKSGAIVEHAFEQPGRYTVRFLADDGRNSNYSITELTKEVVVNAPPVARISGPGRIEPGTTGTFSASQSVDQDGEITSYKWFFSDGHRAEGPKVTHRFKREGNYAVSLTVTDDAGVSNSVQSANSDVLVAPPPDLTLKLPTVICPEVPLNIAEALSVSEEDSAVVNIMIGSKEISYAAARSHSFAFPGVYNLTVRIDDGSGVEQQGASIRQSIRVNGAPQIYANVPAEVAIGAANDFVRMDAAKSFDPNGDLIKFYWDLGDGTEKMGKNIVHEYKEPGTYTVRVTAIDDKELKCSIARKEYQVNVTRD